MSKKKRKVNAPTVIWLTASGFTLKDSAVSSAAFLLKAGHHYEELSLLPFLVPLCACRCVRPCSSGREESPRLLPCPTQRWLSRIQAASVWRGWCKKQFSLPEKACHASYSPATEPGCREQTHYRWFKIPLQLFTTLSCLVGLIWTQSVGFSSLMKPDGGVFLHLQGCFIYLPFFFSPTKKTLLFHNLPVHTVSLKYTVHTPLHLSINDTDSF